MVIKIVANPIKRIELLELAREEFRDVIKAAVDIEQEIMAVGGELHADEEVFLQEEANSKREHVWGINFYPQKSTDDWIEFDSMINLKPTLGNRSRTIKDPAVLKKIKEIVNKLVID